MSSNLIVTHNVETQKSLVSIYHRENDKVAVGTGFFIDGPDPNFRYILTCAHCIIDYTNASSIQYASDLNVSSSLGVFVFYPEGKMFFGSDVIVIGFDFFLDVALLTIPKITTTYSGISQYTLTLGDERDVNICYTGAEVFSPKYDCVSDTLGFVRGTVVNSLTQFGQSSYPDCVLCDIPMQPGNSGSPVMVQGKIVIGIVSFLYPKNVLNQYTSVIGSYLIKYLINYFLSKMNSIPFPIQYPLQCLGFDYTFTNPLLLPQYFNSNKGAYVRRLHYHHIPSNTQQHLKVGDIVVLIGDPENNNVLVPLKNNIFKILYKLGGGESHMDVLKLSGSLNSLSGSFVINGETYNVSSSFPIYLSGSVVDDSLIVISKVNSTQSWNLFVNGTVVAGVMSTGIFNNKLIVNSGSALLTLRVVNSPNPLFDNFKITGVLHIENNSGNTTNMISAPYINDHVTPNQILKTKMTSLGGINSDNIIIDGTISSSLTSLPNLNLYRVNVNYLDVSFDSQGNYLGKIDKTISLNSEDFHFNMLDYIPTYRQLLDNAQYIYYNAYFADSEDYSNEIDK